MKDLIMLDSSAIIQCKAFDIKQNKKGMIHIQTVKQHRKNICH